MQSASHTGFTERMLMQNTCSLADMYLPTCNAGALCPCSHVHDWLLSILASVLQDGYSHHLWAA